jgi:hypothetical protein
MMQQFPYKSGVQNNMCFPHILAAAVYLRLIMCNLHLVTFVTEIWILIINKTSNILSEFWMLCQVTFTLFVPQKVPSSAGCEVQV